MPFLLKVESGRQVYRILVVHKLRFLHEALVLVVETVIHHVVLQHTSRPYTAHHQADVARDSGDYIGVAHTGIECPPVQQEQDGADTKHCPDMPPCDVFAPYSSGAEARQTEKHQCEKFGVEGGVEKTAGAVEVGADLMDGRIEPAAVHGFHAGEPVKVGDNQHDTDCPQEIHDLCQRSEVVLLLAHNKMWN